MSKSMEAVAVSLEAALQRVAAGGSGTNDAVKDVMACVSAMHEAVAAAPEKHFSADQVKLLSTKLFAAFSIKADAPRVLVLKLLVKLVPASASPAPLVKKFGKAIMQHLGVSSLKLQKKNCMQLLDTYIHVFAACAAAAAPDVLRALIKADAASFKDFLKSVSMITLLPMPRDTLCNFLLAISHLLAAEADAGHAAPAKLHALKQSLSLAGFDPAAVARLATAAHPPRPSHHTPAEGDSLDLWRGLGPVPKGSDGSDGSAAGASAPMAHALALVSQAVNARRAAAPGHVQEALRAAGTHTFVGCSVTLSPSPASSSSAHGITAADAQLLLRCSVAHFSVAGLALGLAAPTAHHDAFFKLSWAQLSAIELSESSNQLCITYNGKACAFVLEFPTPAAFEAAAALLQALLTVSAGGSSKEAPVLPSDAAAAALDTLVAYGNAAFAATEPTMQLGSDAGGGAAPAFTPAAADEADDDTTLTQTQAPAPVPESQAPEDDEAAPLQSETLRLSQVAIPLVKPKCSKSAPIMAAVRATRPEAAELPDFSSTYLPGHKGEADAHASSAARSGGRRDELEGDHKAPSPPPTGPPATASARKATSARTSAAPPSSAGPSSAPAKSAPATAEKPVHSDRGRVAAQTAPRKPSKSAARTEVEASPAAAPAASGRPKRAAAQAAAVALALQAAGGVTSGSDSESDASSGYPSPRNDDASPGAPPSLPVPRTPTAPAPSSTMAAAKPATTTTSTSKTTTTSALRPATLTAAASTAVLSGAAKKATALDAITASSSSKVSTSAFDWDEVDGDEDSGGGKSAQPAGKQQGSTTAQATAPSKVAAQKAVSASKSSPHVTASTAGKPEAGYKATLPHPPSSAATPAKPGRSPAATAAAAAAAPKASAPPVGGSSTLSWAVAGSKRPRSIEPSPLLSLAADEGSDGEGSTSTGSPITALAAGASSKRALQRKPAKVPRLTGSASAVSDASGAPTPPTFHRGRLAAPDSTSKSIRLALLDEEQASIGASSATAASASSSATTDSLALPGSSSAAAAGDPIVALRQRTAAFAREAARLCPESEAIGKQLVASAEAQIEAFYGAVVAKLMQTTSTASKRLEAALADLAARSGGGLGGPGQGLAQCYEAFNRRTQQLEEKLQALEASITVARARHHSLHSAFRSEVRRREEELAALQEAWQQKVEREKKSAMADIDAICASVTEGPRGSGSSAFPSGASKAHKSRPLHGMAVK